jgi:hypothetical protein
MVSSDLGKLDQAPAHSGLGVHGWGNAGSQHAGDTGFLIKGTTIHGESP